jgi:hypothetical protein
MARRSGSVTTVDLPFADRGFDLFCRGFFDTGICSVPILLRRRADHRGSASYVNRRAQLSTVRSPHWPYSQPRCHQPAIGSFYLGNDSQDPKWALFKVPARHPQQNDKSHLRLGVGGRDQTFQIWPTLRNGVNYEHLTMEI